MTLEEAVAAFEAKFTMVSDDIGFPPDDKPGERNWSRAPNGELYVTVTDQGPKPPGTTTDWNRKTEHSAADHWLKWATALWNQNGDILYWRERPKIHRGHFGKNGRTGLRVHSRLQFGHLANPSDDHTTHETNQE